MERSLNALFAESGGEPVAVGGETVHIAYKRHLDANERFTVEFLRWTPDRLQGLNLRAQGGELEVNQVRSPVVSLWLDTAPPLIEVLCVKQPSPHLMVSNQWRRPDGVDDEWTNNAGILVEEARDQVLLRCSDGFGQPDFTNLVVSLRFSRIDSSTTTAAGAD